MMTRRAPFALFCAAVLTACTAQTDGPAEAETAQTAQAGVTVIRGGTVLTMEPGTSKIHPDGVVVVEGDTILAVGRAELAEDYPDATVIDATGDIVMPGMVNAHNHLSMVAFRGAAETGILDFEDRLVNYFFPLEARLLTRDHIRISARQAAIESAVAGVTTIADMYYHEDEVATAMVEVGLRGVLGESVIGFPVVDAPEPYAGIAYARDFIADWQDHPLITPAFAPHAPYTVSAEKLREVKAASDALEAPILIHLDEVGNEAEMTRAFALERGDPTIAEGQTVVEYLDEIGFLGPRVVGAHVNHVTPSDIAILKARGVGISHNPKANTKDMSGVSPAWQMYTRDLDIGLGTDGPMSSNQMDILNVMPFAVRLARIADRDIARFDPAEVVEMATLGGARALNMADEIGSLEAGKRADIVILSTDAPNMQPVLDPYATVVFQAYPSDVELVMVNGEIVARDGVATRIDMEAHRVEWTNVVARVRRVLGEILAEG